MKAYIGNKTVVLASSRNAPAEMEGGPEGQEGYNVKYFDGSETWLTKEIFEFEFREFTDEESNMVIDAAVEYSDEVDVKELMEELRDEGENISIPQHEIGTSENKENDQN